MKRFILALLALVMLAGSANAQSKKRTIDPESLPKAATELIQKHWPSCAIDFAYVKGREYEALLTDGTIIEFDSKGVRKEMKCTEGLPVTLVPGYITRYIVNRYPKQLIIDCEKMKGGYEITLTNGVDPENPSTQIIVDDAGQWFYLENFDMNPYWWTEERYSMYHPYIIGDTG